MERVSRRDMLLTAGATAGFALAGPAPADAAPQPRRRTVRIAHLTDIHVQPELRAGEGMAHCLAQVHALPDRPDAIFLGGDLVMDAMGADWTRTKSQWDVWSRVLRENCKIRVEACIGNHDVWGWNRPRSGASGNEPLYGKKAAQEQLGLAERFRSFDLGGWHVVVLDSTFPKGDGYTARLDDAQREWLAGDLKATPPERPVLVLSHIPILCGCAFLDGNNEKSGDWVVPGAWMHTDARAIKDLFHQHRNVRVCLSGHIHLRDRLEYNGVTYLCNGAVCGGWWKGDYQETKPGFALVDLYDDGSFDCEYVNTGWHSTRE